ncbi:hypothetical protein L1887_18610 [Cichorium endivia]|nr:hypothetical protein L1887_18610 [Cichorium endivia]
MGIMKSIVTICLIILVVVGPTTMASKPFPFDARPDEVCCYPGYPCCDVPFPPGADEDEDSVAILAPSPSMAHEQKTIKPPSFRGASLRPSGMGATPPGVGLS